MSKPKIVCISLWKGGVGKTTTAVNLSAGLAMAGKRVLVIDDDPQANATIALLPKSTVILNSTRSLYFQGALQNATYPSVVLGLDIVPATMDLATVELEITSKIGRERLLQKALKCDFAKQYDYIIIDTPPLLGSIVINALSAADELLIPVKGFYSLEGIQQFLDVIESVRENVNPNLKIGSVLLTMYDDHLLINRDIKKKVTEVFGERVLKTTIPPNIRLDEAPSYNQAIFSYDPDSKGAQAYKHLTEELLSWWEA